MTEGKIITDGVSLESLKRHPNAETVPKVLGIRKNEFPNPSLDARVCTSSAGSSVWSF